MVKFGCRFLLSYLFLQSKICCKCIQQFEKTVTSSSFVSDDELIVESITTNVVSSNPTHGEVYSMQ